MRESLQFLFRSRLGLLAGSLVLFVLLWPLDRRHLVFTEHSFITGAYTEATTLALYASDLAFFVLVAAWGLSIFKQPREIFPSRPVVWLGGAFAAWVVGHTLLPTFFPGETSPLLGWYGTTRVLQGLLLAGIIASVWHQALLRKLLLGTLLASGLFQSLLGISQVLQETDLGLRFLGEHPLSLETTGVAKVNVGEQEGVERVPTETVFPEKKEGTRSIEEVPVGTKVLRAYGTFPHPNVLAAFLLLSFISGVVLLREERGTLGTIVLSTVSLVLVGILFTFSRSAWIALVLMGAIVGICSYRNRLELGTGSSSVWKWAVPPLLGVSLILLLFPAVRSAAVSRVFPEGGDQFVSGRISSYHDTFDLIASRPILGTGPGNGFLALVRREVSLDSEGKYVPMEARESWQFQYPHAVPLVIFLELGVLGFGIFLAFLVASVWPVLSAPLQSPFRGTSGRVLGICALLLLLATLGLLDHYLWTIQQGRIALWGIIGVVLSLSSQQQEKQPSG